MCADSTKAHPFPWGYALAPLAVALALIAYAVFYEGVDPRPSRAGVQMTEAGYKGEIYRHVIEPCLKTAYQRNEELQASMTEEEAVQMLSIVIKPFIEESYRTGVPIVQNMPDKADRQVFYEFGKRTCIQALAASQ